jgi:hypothetical protein
MCCGTRMTRFAAGVPASFVKEGTPQSRLTDGFCCGDSCRVRAWLARWLPCPEAPTLGNRRVRSFDRRVRPTDHSACWGLQPPPVRVPVAAHTERVNTLLDACVRPKSCDASRRALFGESRLHDAYTAISQIPIRFTDDRRHMTSKHLVNGGGA